MSVSLVWTQRCDFCLKQRRNMHLVVFCRFGAITTSQHREQENREQECRKSTEQAATSLHFGACSWTHNFWALLDTKLSQSLKLVWRFVSYPCPTHPQPIPPSNIIGKTFTDRSVPREVQPVHNAHLVLLEVCSWTCNRPLQIQTSILGRTPGLDASLKCTVPVEDCPCQTCT